MIVATDVIRMGRSRIRPASSTASSVSMPRSFSWLVYSTSRIEFLVTRPISRIMPIWLYRLMVEPASLSVKQRAGHRERHGQQHRERVHQRLELRASTMNTTTSARTKAK